MAERIFVALDLETTGLDSRQDAIIEIGAVRFCGETILDRFSTFVDPQRPIPPRIQQLTGITDRDVATAPTLARVLPELLAFVDGSVQAVVAHNAAFDLSFLQAAGVNFHRPALDTHELATILLPRLSGYGVEDLCRHLGVPLLNAHRALADAEATARIFMQVTARIRTLAPAALHTLIACGAESTWPPLLLFQDACADLGPPGKPPEQRNWLSAPSAGELAVPAGEIQPVAVQRVEAAFAPASALAQEMGDGYEMRHGQVAMARLVLEGLNKGRHQIIEAGTGTGKSLAYLLPAALWAVTNGQRVVIATDTLTLQDQLVAQEVPRVQRLLACMDADAPVRTALLKGRRHYLCLRRLRAWCTDRSLPPKELRLLARVLVWLPETSTGDVGELTVHDPQERTLLQQITSDPVTCTEERCGVAAPHAAELPGWASAFPVQDFYWAARQQAQHAHLLIVNHALLMADLQHGRRLLPVYNHLIIDEAHRLEQAATEQLTYRADVATMEGIFRQLQLLDHTHLWVDVDPHWVQMARQLDTQIRHLIPATQTFVASVLRVVLRQPEVEDALGQPQRVDLGALRPQARWSQVELEWDTLSGSLQRAIRQAGDLAAAVESSGGWQREPQASLLAQIHQGRTSLQELDQSLECLICQGGHSAERVSWLELNAEATQLTFCVAPLHVSDLLEKQLMRTCRTVVLTGATLRTDEGFEFMQERLGCWECTATVIESPFDYRNHVLLYLPSDLPMPDRPGYQATLEQAIVEAAAGAQGRTLVLFTSHAHLRSTADAVRSPLDQRGIALLEHGFSSRGRLLREFRSGRKAVLMGTGTFWEGIDLPGELLSCLVLVRLPFAVPTDPLFLARSQAYDDPFHEYTVPDAVLRFRQGFGRLIRRADDRGVVVLLDSRAWRKPYGAAFLEALPACTVRHAPLMNLRETTAQWLANESWTLPAGYDGWGGTYVSEPLDR